jgi:hypothetical protein
MNIYFDITAENAAFMLMHQYLNEKNTILRFNFLRLIRKTVKKNIAKTFLQEAYRIDTSDKKGFDTLLQEKNVRIIKTKDAFRGVRYCIKNIILNLDKWQHHLLNNKVLVNAKLAAIKLVGKKIYVKDDLIEFSKKARSFNQSNEALGEFFLQKYYNLHLKILKSEEIFEGFLEKQGMVPLEETMIKQTEEQIGKLLKSWDGMGDVIEYQIQTRKEK